MSNSSLPISRLVKVDVTLTPQAAQAQNISTLLILGTSLVIDTNQRIRLYETLAAVAADFGTSAPEYLAASLWFEQAPQPTQLYIGRWAKTAAAGQLICAPLSAAQQAIGNFTSINNGGFTVSIDGAPMHIHNINLTGVLNLNGVAAAIQAALGGAATCVWNSVQGTFIFTSLTTGLTSSVGFLSAPNSAISDLGLLLAGEANSSGAYLAPGIAAETAVAAVTLFDAAFGQLWYAVTVLNTAADVDLVAVSNYIEGANTKHLHGISTQEAGVLVLATTSDIASLVQVLDLNRTVTQFSSSSPYSICSLLGRMLTVDYTGNNTAITIMFKQEPGIVAENLSASQIQSCNTKNCNVFVEYNNDTAIIEQGKVASGQFLDTITGVDWLAIDVQTALYNTLYTTPTKIPQTDAGMHLLATTIEAICVQGVNNGVLAPGIWNSAGVGAIKQGDFLEKGYYVFAPPVALQNQSDRAARKSVLFQVLVKLAGAVQSVDVSIIVNQ